MIQRQEKLKKEDQKYLDFLCSGGMQYGNTPRGNKER